MNERIFQLFRKKYCFFIEQQTIFWDKIFKKQIWKNYRFFLMNKRFYKTNDFNDRSVFEKTNNNFENEKNHFFKQLKETNEMGRSQTINERNEEVERADIYDNANISLLDLQRYP